MSMDILRPMPAQAEPLPYAIELVELVQLEYSRTSMEQKTLRIIRFISAAVHIAGLAAMVSGIGTLVLLPVLAWSGLFFIAADNQVRESNSIFLGKLHRTASILAASIQFGVLLEAANFILGHRYYVGFPFEIWLRWPLFIFSFAVMIPLILEIERKLENLGLAEILTWKKLSVSRGLIFALLASGILLLVPLAMIPASFYPLLWIALLLLTDPLVHLLGPEGKSIIGQFEEAYYGQVFRLITSGILFGFFWEFWNFGSGAKWFYIKPEIEQAFLFELPALEFWGYAFTALAGYAFYQLYLVFEQRIVGESSSGPVRVLGLLFLLAILAAVLVGMDELTTVAFRQVF